MDRRDTVRLFRQRLEESMADSGLSRAGLARKVGIDRSTVSQLLSPDNDRLPRADTVAAMASALQVSLDWLLGASQEQTIAADIMEQAPQIESSDPRSADARLSHWHKEAAGYKIRYRPATLPDLLKSPEVIRHEYAPVAIREPERAMADAADRLAYSRLPETDMEVCSTVQELNDFVAGAGIWRGLSGPARVHQVEEMIRLIDELYPSFRWFLYDGRTRYSVPLTIFGPQRAVVYMGQMFFVFHTTEHIRVLTRHFDQLIRAAVVQPTEIAGYLRQRLDGEGP